MCLSQQRTVSVLIDNNLEYSDITFVRADWDLYRGSELVKELKVRRRSTLIMFRDGEEVARVIAQNNEDTIENMFKAATG